MSIWIEAQTYGHLEEGIISIFKEYLGAHKETRGEQEGFTFRVWAPNAQAVDLIGDFTDWEARKIPMVRNEGGVWEVFCSDAKEEIYTSIW